MTRTHCWALFSLAGLLLGIALGSSGCATNQRGSAISRSDDGAIRRGSVDFVLHAKAKNWEALGALYTSDAIMMPPNHETVTGRDAIREFFSPLTVVDFELPTLEVQGRGDLAYARGTYSWTVRLGDGPPTPDQGKWLTVWRKQADGRWLLSQDIWNSDQAP